MSGLDERQRKALVRLVVSARATLVDDAEKTLRGVHGILPDGTIQSELGLAPDPALRARRRTLEAVLAHLRADGTSPKGAVERLVREVAFTHLNRLLAIRVADALGVLAPSLRDGARSTGFRQWIGDLAPLLATADDTGGYWTYLSQCADELAVDAPSLFDPRNPLLALRPSKTAFETVVAQLADPENADIWDADDTFGWAFQFFNTRDERQEMRKSSAPRDSRELAVRNQFFTPDYVVQFLVQNSLGRRLVDADPSTPLLDRLPLLIEPPTKRGAPLDLNQVKVLDPACGSGHFLLGCYDVLEAAWELAGVPPAEAATRIVPCLWGVDIDPRAVQVAQAAVIFRARRACGRSPLPSPNIVCARALPDDPAAWDHAQAGLGEDLRRLVQAMRAALRDAPVLGPLLKAERRLAGEIRSTVVGAGDPGDDLFSTAGIAHDAFGSAERAVIAALQRAADATTSTPAERLLAAGASDSVRFVEAVRNRYDAVLMNPPFGEPVESTKDYIRSAYPWIPTRDYNLLAAFVGRGLELCKPDGYLGAITSRAGMFLKTFERWRTEVMLGHRLIALADLGFGVMEEALVEAAAYILSPKLPQSEALSCFIRLLKDAERPEGLATAIAADRAGESEPRVFRVSAEAFGDVPGSPMAYWMGPSMRRLFAELPPLEGNGAEVRVGLQTGDDFRFVRLFWEVPPGEIGRSRGETYGRRWAPFAKGGDYSPYWYDIHLVVDWENDGQRLRDFESSRVQNSQYYFRRGITWPAHTISGFGPRVLPLGCVFGHAAGIIISDSPLQLLGWLMTRTGRACIDVFLAAGDEVAAGGAKKKYEVGVLQNTPSVLLKLRDAHGLEEAAAELVRLSHFEDQFDETSRHFEGPRILGVTSEFGEPRTYQSDLRRFVSILELAREVEATVDDAIGLDDSGRQYVDDELGPNVLAYPRRQPILGIEAYWNLQSDQLSDAAVKAQGGAKYLSQKVFYADRRVEVMAHVLETNGVDVARDLAQHPPHDFASRLASDLISYLVGVAFGRWDPRGARSRGDFDPFGLVPLCPPAMLIGKDGLPIATVPDGYPIALPRDGVLLDQLGHALDLGPAVESAADVLGDFGGEMLSNSVQVVGYRSVRDYLAKAFFKDHLSRYSKSRRQAPIYWQLTVPSGSWSAWLYAPRFTREMLYAVVTLADHRLADAAERIRSLQDDTSDSERRRAKALDQERAVAAELQNLRDDVARLASLGWQPDPDDGFVLCAAPLARWFPRNTWRQLSEQIAAIKGGDYPWSTVHRFRSVL